MAGGRRGRARTSEETERKHRILARSDVFAGLEEERVEELARRSSLLQVARRGELEPGRSVFVVGSGRLRQCRRCAEREITLDYYGPGALVGETVVLGDAEAPPLVACEPAEVLSMAVLVLRRQLGDSKLTLRLAKLVAERRAAVERRLEGVLTRPVESRIAEFLLLAADRYGVPGPRGTLLGLKVTHQEIASYVGATRETVTLVLSELRRQGVVATEHRRLVITDAEGLRNRL